MDLSEFRKKLLRKQCRNSKIIVAKAKLKSRRAELNIRVYSSAVYLFTSVRASLRAKDYEVSIN